MMRSIFLVMSMLVISTSAFSSPNLIKAKAQFLYCNPFQVSYCHKTFAYGEGRGLIVFKNVRLKNAAIRAGGSDSIAVSMMTGELEAIEVMTLRDHRDQYYVSTKEYTVVGNFEKSLNKDVFYIWSIAY